MKQSLLVCLALLCGISSCTKIDAPGGARQRSEYADLNYDDSLHVEQRDGNKLKWSLRACSLKRWPNKANLTQVYGVSIDLYDSTGALSAWLRADSALIFDAGNRIQVYGSARARSPKNLEISSDSLWIERSMNSVHTEAPVRILTPQGDLLSGKGLKSDLKLENWQILSKVKAIFQNFGPRMDSTEQKQGASSSSQSTPALKSTPKAPSLHPDMDAPDVE